MRPCTSVCISTCDAQERFQRALSALGVSKRISSLGVKSGDTIMVGDVDFKYYAESSMAARARLAGYGDDEEEGDIYGMGAGVEGEMTPRQEARRRRREREMEAELKDLLDADGEVTRFT